MTRCPLTFVPFVLPRSRKNNRPSVLAIKQCSLEILLWSMYRSQTARFRPINVTSCVIVIGGEPSRGMSFAIMKGFSRSQRARNHRRSQADSAARPETGSVARQHRGATLIVPQIDPMSIKFDPTSRPRSVYVGSSGHSCGKANRSNGSAAHKGMVEVWGRRGSRDGRGYRDEPR